MRVAVLGVALLAGCRGGDSKPEADRLPTVRVLAVRRATLVAHIQVGGVLSPLPGRDVKVGALVAGRVDRVWVAEGDPVTVGQLLAHVEAQPLQQRVTETDAQQSQAAAQRENARTRLARAEKLFRDGIASRQEVDDARAALASADSGVKQAQAMGGTAAVQLSRASLRAPIAGTVAAILIPAGQPVEGNGTPVIEIADTRELDLRAPVPVGLIGEVALGQRAELDIEGAGVLAGTVEAIAPLVDTATNTVMVRIRVANRDGRLRGGMFARGALLGPPHEALSVPRSALLPGDGGSATRLALLRADGTVAHRSIRLGAETGEAIEVRAGLQEGERVIIAGGYALPEGAKVEVAP